eukprot:TRINITY_DN19320_c0_g1::TRINITY_DN19320_c0_g1_i1::g.15795::m.15795 TRINITY_DN19320_c0_g1::TRINITY_DN19320_c0_g1_i1::g.15795  ORF type:complete len:102 (+),score=3.98,DUF2946/PF11162.3/0.023 TRINITY_DN19320_c0_g1_i1:676-981(+)
MKSYVEDVVGRMKDGCSSPRACNHLDARNCTCPDAGTSCHICRPADDAADKHHHRSREDSGRAQDAHIRMCWFCTWLRACTAVDAPSSVEARMKKPGMLLH